jgi:hypothetical protein
MNVVSLLGPTEQQPDRLAELLERRDALHAELAALSKPEATRAAAAATISACEDELRLAWTSDPSREPPVDQRQDIERRLALAVADERSAAAACAAAQERVKQISTELRQLGQQLYKCKLEIVLAEAGEIERQLREAQAVRAEKSVRLRALYLALCDEKVAVTARGEEQSELAAEKAFKTKLDKLVHPAMRKGPTGAAGGRERLADRQSGFPASRPPPRARRRAKAG